MLCGDLNGREIQGRRDICIYVVPSREGNGTPLQDSCLENPMDGGAWWAAVHGVAKSRIRLSDFTFTFLHWRRKWQPTPVFLPGESQGRGRTESDTSEATWQQQQQAFPGGSAGKESACSAGDLRSVPGRRKRPPTPVLWPGGSMYSPWGRKESDTTETFTRRLHKAHWGASPVALEVKNP